MSEPILMPVRPGTLSEKDKMLCSNAGVIVIECDDPSQIRLIRPCAEVTSTEMLRAAMEALTTSHTYGDTGKAQRERFASAMAEIILGKKK